MIPKRAGPFKHPDKPVWCISYYVSGRPRHRWEEIGTRAEAVRAYRDHRRHVYERVEKTKRERRAPLPKRFSGPYEYPSGSGQWWIGFTERGRRRRVKVGSREEAIKAYELRCPNVIRRHESVSFPIPFRAGIFEHPAGSGQWWIGYTETDEQGARHRRRVRAGSRREAAEGYESIRIAARVRLRNALWGTDEKRKRTGEKISTALSTAEAVLLKSTESKKNWNRLRQDPKAYSAIISKMKEGARKPEVVRAKRESFFISQNDPLVAAARTSGLVMGTQARRDPQVRAASLAKKIRKHLLLIGLLLTDEQYAGLERNLFAENLERAERIRSRKRKPGGQIERIYELTAADFYEGDYTWREVAEKYFPSQFKRDPDGTIHNVKVNSKRAWKRMRRAA